MVILVFLPAQHSLGKCQEPFTLYPETSMFLIKLTSKVISKIYNSAVL